METITPLLIQIQISGLTSPSGNCSVGYYCSLAAIVPNPTSETFGDICPIGHYCPEGTASPVPCPVGTYQPNTGMGQQLDCLACPGGFYCGSQGLHNTTGRIVYTVLPRFTSFQSTSNSLLCHFSRINLSSGNVMSLSYITYIIIKECEINKLTIIDKRS